MLSSLNKDFMVSQETYNREKWRWLPKWGEISKINFACARFYKGTFQSVNMINTKEHRFWSTPTSLKYTHNYFARRKRKLVYTVSYTNVQLAALKPTRFGYLKSLPASVGSTLKTHFKSLPFWRAPSHFTTEKEADIAAFHCFASHFKEKCE